MKDSLLLDDRTSLEQVLRQLDKNGNGFVALVDPAGILKGIVTDGDIRRAMINREFDLGKIINHKPIVAREDVPHVKIKQQLRELHRRHMPIVNGEGKLIDVVVLDELDTSLKENWVVIMAGGLGSRLGELTKDIPKPMLTVGGKPILQKIIEGFKTQGFYRFVLCVNYKSHVIEKYFGDGQSFGIEIRYTHETKRMGTAGALGLIDFNLELPFFVVNGDVLTSINFDDFLNFHNVNRSDATMCIKKFAFDVPYATVEFDANNALTGLREKPSLEYYVNTGMYVLNPDIITYIPKNDFYDMPTLFETLVDAEKNTKVFKIDEYWLDVGKPSDFSKANNDMMNRDLT